MLDVIKLGRLKLVSNGYPFCIDFVAIIEEFPVPWGFYFVKNCKLASCNFAPIQELAFVHSGQYSGVSLYMFF